MFHPSQRGLSVGSRTEVLHLGQFQRQTVHRQRIGHIILIVDRKRFSPIALPAENRITEPVIDPTASDTPFFDFGNHSRNSLLNIHSGQKVGIDHLARLGIVRLYGEIPSFNHRNDRQIEVAGECIVAAVVGRHRHDCTRSVTGEHVIADVDRNLHPVERIDRIGPGKLSADPFRIGHTFPFRPFLGLLKVFVHGLLILRCGQPSDQFMLRSQHHKRNAKDRIGPRGKDLELLLHALDREKDLCSLAPSDPVALDLLQRVAPLQSVQSVEHPLRIGCNPQQPLFHPFLLYRETTPDRQPVLHFVIGQHGS